MERNPHRFSRREFNHKILCITTGLAAGVVTVDGVQKFMGLNGVIDAAVENPQAHPGQIVSESQESAEVDTKLRQVLGMAQIYFAIQSLTAVGRALTAPLEHEQD